MDAIVEEMPERWTARPLLLAGLGLAAGIVAHLILGERNLGDFAFTALQGALVTGVTVGAVLIGFTIERRDWLAALLFGVALGIAAGFVSWWNGAPGSWSQGEVWRTMSLFLAVAIAAPLFQAARGEGSWRPSYPAVHDHLWANVVLWFASWAFVGLVFLMTVLLSGLFQLIKIDLLHDLLMKNWFCRVLIGLAFGSALGVLREHDAVVQTLQRVITTLLAVLAPVLAIGLALFLLALPFTGVQALWDATSATTPLLLACAAGALVFCNDVIGAHEADERRNPLLRHAAMVLAAVILPLGALAAVATSLRIQQYGYTPERLWAVVFVGIACLWGAAYLVALVRGRMQWTRRVRPANLVLAALVCVLGFVLATPLISFNAISTRDQVSRLESGKTKPDKFDWRALAFDFGKPGRDALAKLRTSGSTAIRAKAEEAAKAESRWDLREEVNSRPRPEDAVLANARLLPAGAAAPQGLIDLLGKESACRPTSRCTLVMANPVEVLKLDDDCYGDLKAKPGEKDGDKLRRGAYCLPADRYLLRDGKWTQVTAHTVATPSGAALEDGYRDGKVEIRTVPRRQVFVGNVAVGEPFE